MSDAAGATSIVIPAFNEVDSIDPLVAALRAAAPWHEILVVDDGSTDDTGRRAAAAGARVIRHPYNKGNGAAVKSGIRHATGRFVLILDADGQKELDRLWREFDFITGSPMRQHTSFLWFERTDSAWLRDPEFDTFRAEDKDCTSEEKIRKLAEVYLDKAKRRGASARARRCRFRTGPPHHVGWRRRTAAGRWVMRPPVLARRRS